MAASHHPKEFFWKPFRLTAEPVRFSKTANAIDLLVDIRRTKRIEPTIKRNGIIVKKNYD